MTGIKISSLTGGAPLTPHDFVAIQRGSGNYKLSLFTGISTYLANSFVGNTNITTLGTISAGSIPEIRLTFTDVTTNNASISTHGFVPKLPNDARLFYDGAGGYTMPTGMQPVDSNILFSDITTNNVTSTRHGFIPKFPNDPNVYFNGVGGYSSLSGQINTGLLNYTGSTSITTVGTLSVGAIPETLLTFTDVTTNNATTVKHGFVPKLPNNGNFYYDGTGGYSFPTGIQPVDSNILFSDITTNNVSTTRHGFAPKLPNNATLFLNGTGGYTFPTGIQPVDSNILFSDITTNNASVSQHGFLPKLPNNSSQFLNGVGNWVTVTGGAGGTGVSQLTLAHLGSTTALSSNYLYTGLLTGRTVTLPSASNQDVIVFRGIAALDSTVVWPSDIVLQVGSSGYVASTNFLSGSNVEFSLSYAAPYWFLADSAAPSLSYYYTGGPNVAVVDGGTNIDSYASGDLLYASSATVLSKLARGTSGQIMTMGSVYPQWVSGSITGGGGGAGIPGGSSGQLQWNNGGSFAGVSASQVSGSTVYISGFQVTGTCQLPALYGSDGTTRLNVAYTGYMTGLYALTTGASLLNNGTITLTASGNYMLWGRTYLKYNNATFAGNQTGTIKLRRTNNTATDVSFSTTSPVFDVVTSYTGGIGVITTPPVMYTSTATGDIIGVFGSLSAAPGAGSVEATEASVMAIRLWE